MLQIANKSINNKTRSIKAKNQDIFSNIGDTSSGGDGESIENLLSVVDLTRSKKSISSLASTQILNILIFAYII